MQTLISGARHGGVWVSLLVGVVAGSSFRSSAGFSTRPGQAGFDYATPSTLTGEILAKGGAPRKLLFRFNRVAVASGATVQVCREYLYPDGAVAVRSRLRYEAGRLAALETEELQTGERGVAVLRADPKNPARRRIFFEYTIGEGSNAKISVTSEALENDTLADDMVAGFIASHWGALSQGQTVKFRYIALARKETVGFKLTRESETLWHGTPVLRVRMEPTSLLLAPLVDPMFFVVEKSAPHRILEYIGRTAPLLREGPKWKDLDADTVFHWEGPANDAPAIVPAISGTGPGTPAPARVVRGEGG